ncbi:uncharacterized protein [Panulirus ornatus]
MVKPYSCWCDNPGATCPAHIPNALLYQVMNVTCGDIKIHCCLVRELDQDSHQSQLMASYNNSTVEELGIFLDYIIDTLKPYKNKTLMESITRESEVLPEGSSHGPYCPKCQQFKKILSSNNQDVTKKTMYKRGIRRPTHILEDDLVALKGVAQYLLNLTARPWNIDITRANPPVVSLRRRGIQFSNLSEYYHHKGLKEGMSADIRTKDLMGLYNASDDIIKRGEFILPYGSLGWFSKAVEMAVDGSLYVGLALVVMFFAASLLTGGMTLIGDTCFICSIIGYVNAVHTP